MPFIVALEGLPGCGKSTAIRNMMGKLRKQGQKAEAVDVESIAPDLHKAASGRNVSRLSKIMVFWALRLMQNEAIKKTSDRFDIVFADRFWGSVLAIDIYGNKVPEEILEWVGKDVAQPDLTFLFEAPLEVARKRKKSRITAETDFARRVVRGYGELAEKYGWLRIDATKAPEEICEECLKEICSRITLSAT